MSLFRPSRPTVDSPTATGPERGPSRVPPLTSTGARPSRPTFMVLAALCGAALLAGCSGRSASDTRTVQQPPPRYDTSRVPPYLPKDLLPDATRKSDEKVKVALLLPFSGQHSGIADSMLKAAQLAVFDVADENFELIPLDTRGTPDGASEAARSAMGQGVKLILGPLLGSSVRSASIETRGSDLNIVAFSNDRMVAGNGVYLMGFLPGEEIARTVAFASSKGYRSMAGFAPDNPYGRLALDSLQSSAGRYGATVTRTRLVPENPDALAASAREFAAGQSYDALLLPYSGPSLNEAVRQLQSAGVDTSRTKLMGTGQWNQPSLYQEPLLHGGWFATVPPETRATFERRFQQTYGNPPPRLATLAYDATALAALIAATPDARFDAAALTNPRGFAGADGYFRFRPDGTAQRGLAVMEVVPGGLRAVDRAPTRAEDLSS